VSSLCPWHFQRCRSSRVPCRSSRDSFAGALGSHTTCHCQRHRRTWRVSSCVPCLCGDPSRVFCSHSQYLLISGNYSVGSLPPSALPSLHRGQLIQQVVFNADNTYPAAPGSYIHLGDSQRSPTLHRYVHNQPQKNKMECISKSADTSNIKGHER
jgi:hypothetical protein